MSKLQLLNQPINAEEAQIHIWALAGGTVAMYTARAPDKKTPNEDAVIVIPVGTDSAIVAVADGAGGMPAGDQASDLALKVLLSAVEQTSRGGGELREAMLNGLEQANDAILALANGSSTTFAGVEVDGNVVRPYHVGDSMVLVVGQRGLLKMQTVSHSLVGYAVEAGLLEEEEALHHEERHLVSNMLGTPEMRIEIGPVLELAVRDTLLIASDGLFDNLTTEEILDEVRKGPLEQCATSLASMARERMENPLEGRPSKPDDLSFILFRRKA